MEHTIIVFITIGVIRFSFLIDYHYCSSACKIKNYLPNKQIIPSLFFDAIDLCDSIKLFSYSTTAQRICHRLNRRLRHR